MSSISRPRAAAPSRADFNKPMIDKYRDERESRGHNDKGFGMLLLTTQGRRSGLQRTCPLGSSQVGDQLVVVASAAGSPRDPDWVRNVADDPRVTVELGPETFPARARIVTGAERAHLYACHVANYPVYAHYEDMTNRAFPVVVLERDLEDRAR